MIAFFKRLWLAYQKARRISACRRFGHMMVHCGEMSPGTKEGLITGKAEFWLYSCQNRCGHGEVNEVGLHPYTRSWNDAEKLKTEMSQELKPR